MNIANFVKRNLMLMIVISLTLGIGNILGLGLRITVYCGYVCQYQCQYHK